MKFHNTDTSKTESMDRGKSGFRLGVFYILYLLVIGAVAVRMIPHYMRTANQWAVIGLLVLYLTLFFLERIRFVHKGLVLQMIFPIELAIILILLFLASETAPKDYFINLVLPLCGHAAWNFPGRIARRWVVIFCIFCLGSMLAYYGNIDGLSFGLTYMAGCLLISILISVTLNADQARMESQRLLEELKEANLKLEEYAHQVETLAAAEERNRLARELHDSVSQIIFSMNLTSQSARILFDKDPAQVPGMLDHLQNLSQNALAEMRSLIQQLRPNLIAQYGLVAAIKKHISERFEQDGLYVVLNVNGDRTLSEQVENGLFRLIQEALNNVVKHAGTDEATINLTLQGEHGSLVIEDHGKGFDFSTLGKQPGHMGLASMEERVRSFGGLMKVKSSLGNGTRIMVDQIPFSENDT